MRLRPEAQNLNQQERFSAGPEERKLVCLLKLFVEEVHPRAEVADACQLRNVGRELIDGLDLLLEVVLDLVLHLRVTILSRHGMKLKQVLVYALLQIKSLWRARYREARVAAWH